MAHDLTLMPRLYSRRSPMPMQEAFPPREQDLLCWKHSAARRRASHLLCRRSSARAMEARGRLAVQTRAAGFSAAGREIPHALLSNGMIVAEIRSVFRSARGGFVGVFLAILRKEHHVFRAAALSIVLTLAVGPSASLLCRTWCDPHAAAASGCHQEDPPGSPSAGGDDSCDHQVLSAAFVPENVRRALSSPDWDHAIPVPRYQLAHSTIDAPPRHEPGREWPLEKRPLPTVLRI